jgi:hypothetical protein
MKMKTYIYINWEAQEYYTNWDEVVAAYRGNLDSDDFNEFLCNNYSYEEIFEFSEERRAEVLMEYNEGMNADAEYWAHDNLEKVEVKIEVKGE